MNKKQLPETKKILRLAAVGMLFLLTGFSPRAAQALQFSELLGGDSQNIEAKVRSSFSDIPVMIDIARCESGFRQFNNNGSVLRGGNGTVVGVFQISEGAHLSRAKSLGLDIYTADGNIAYARHLYQNQGTDPWMAAFPCWGKQSNTPPQTSTTTPPPAGGPAPLSSDLSFGMASPEVMSLQQLLNKTGYTIAASGPGSPGRETASFGPLTRNAVRRFQCAKGIACSGDEYGSGYGMVGSQTREALLAAAGAGQATLPSAFPLGRDLELGSQGQDVAYLQDFLIKQGLYNGEASGNFDAATKTAAVLFQKNNNIYPQYGYVGPKTRGVIRQLLGI